MEYLFTEQGTGAIVYILYRYVLFSIQIGTHMQVSMFTPLSCSTFVLVAILTININVLGTC